MQPRTTEEQNLVFRVADPVADAAALLRLRDLVYVQDQGRLGDVDDMAGTFDRFNSRAVYILAEERDGAGVEPVGTVKIVEDSPLGLPCEEAVDLSAFRPGKRLAEFGHLMTLPRVRNRSVGMRLMREALAHSVTRLGATHVLGDFFAEADGGLRGFYADLGFVRLGEPYQDARFKDAPLSVVGALDLAAAAQRCRDGSGSAQQQALLRFFFHDYDHLVRPRERPEPSEQGSAARTRRQGLAEAKAAHNHPVYSVMSYVMGCGVQGAGRGSSVADEHGREFLALFDQYGNQSFGYSNERVTAALRDQLDSGRLNSTKIMFEEEQIRLSERLSEATGGLLPFSYLANSGGETVDNALKLARAATGRSGVVSAVDCFHGKTFGALSTSGRPEHLALFAPLLEHFQQVPFNDLAAMERVVGPDTAAVILEPVQAEGGVVVPHPGYLRAVRRLCSERGALLILDEMQTAFGRCGTFFAYEQFGIVPDLLCIGKAFGGGMLPISAVLGTAAVWHALRAVPSSFGSSLGGNPLCCRVGLETVAMASEPEFLAGVRERGALLEVRLGALARRFPGLISEHRGLGMMHGLEFHDESLGGLVLGLLLEHRVTSTYSLYNPRVLRVQPPMVIPPADLERGLAVLEQVLATVDAHLASASHGGPGLSSPLSVSLALDRSAQDVRALLAEHPRLLDPFALDNTAAPGDGPFLGTLGDDPVQWADTVRPTPEGVRASAEPSWLWRRLDREVAVRPGADGSGCTVEITLAWDCGTGPYEALLGGRIGYYAQQRITTLTDRLRSTQWS